MFAILALICFVLVLIHVPLGTVNLVVLGLAFMAAQLAFGSPIVVIPWPSRKSE